MKIYSDTLTTRDLYAALPAGVDLDTDDPAPAKLRAYRFDHVRLTTDHGTRWPNTGTHGARSPHTTGDVAAAHCATYSEHGEWMAVLFARDPRAIIDGIVRYAGRDSFHEQTDGRYRPAPQPHRVAPVIRRAVDEAWGVVR